MADGDVAPIAELADGDVAPIAELAFVDAGPAADDIGHAGEEVADDIGAHDRFAGYEAEMVPDAPAFERVGRRDQHVCYSAASGLAIGVAGA